MKQINHLYAITYEVRDALWVALDKEQAIDLESKLRMRINDLLYYKLEKILLNEMKNQ